MKLAKHIVWHRLLTRRADHKMSDNHTLIYQSAKYDFSEILENKTWIEGLSPANKDICSKVRISIRASESVMKVDTKHKTFVE